jgi:hypothetical protein
MATVLDVIRGLNQAAANAYDGALDENGEALKIGLNREDGDPIIDSRLIDGFKVRFAGPKMIVTYQSEMRVNELHPRNVLVTIRRRRTQKRQRHKWLLVRRK